MTNLRRFFVLILLTAGVLTPQIKGLSQTQGTNVQSPEDQPPQFLDPQNCLLGGYPNIEPEC